MDNCLLSELERTFKKCSDCLLHPDYIANLNKLNNIELSQELIDYLCDKATSKKHIWEIRFDHLRILLLNPSAKAFDLKEFYFENYKVVWDMMAVPTDAYGNIYLEGLFVNSILYSVICTIMHVLTPCIAAYAVAKYNFKFGKFMYGIVIVTMILPVVGNLPSQIQVAKFTGAYDNLWGVAVMKGHFLGTNFLIFYAAFKSLQR